MSALDWTARPVPLPAPSTGAAAWSTFCLGVRSSESSVVTLRGVREKKAETSHMQIPVLFSRANPNWSPDRGVLRFPALHSGPRENPVVLGD